MALLPIAPWLRRTSLLLLVVLLAGCRAELYGRLDETDANAVLDVLYGEGIDAAKLPGESGTWRVEVDEARHQQALHVTRQQGVPKQRFANMGDLFKKEGLVSTPSEERLRYIFAVSQELSSTLSQIDGVVSARVHPVIPVSDPLDDKLRPASAAVFIKHKAEADVPQLAPAIKTLVTRSIEGLSPDHVSLTFFATPSVAPAPRHAANAAPQGGVPAAVAGALAVCLAVSFVVLGLMLHRGRQRGAAPRPAVPLRGPSAGPRGRDPRDPQLSAAAPGEGEATAWPAAGARAPVVQASED